MSRWRTNQIEILELEVVVKHNYIGPFDLVSKVIFRSFGMLICKWYVT